MVERGAWSPLKHSLFRAMWIASVASNIGTWMHTVGASWLMTSLAASPLLVALVQTATTLPIFLLGLPAGVMADLIDRRKLLIFTQSWMLGVAALLGLLVGLPKVFGGIGPWWLLALTFALGAGSAMNGPAWAAAIPELVPRDELPAAVALNSVGFNIARAVGPALGGIVMASAGAGAVFMANAVSFLGVIVVLWSWKERPPAVREPGTRFRDAMREGLVYVRNAGPFHAVLARAGMFSLAGSALWAMLPVVARDELKSTSLGYGILLGCLGAGSVVGAAVLAPVRSRYSVDKIVAVGVVLFAIATIGLAALKTLALAVPAMVVGGMAWITVMSSFNVCAQTIPPQWMRARALAFYLLVFQGALAVGSGLWGEVARHVGVPASLWIAAAAMVAGLAAGRRLKLSAGPVGARVETVAAE
jgi:MFS family permease